MEVYKRLLEGETIDYSGTHIQIEGGQILYEPVQKPHPPFYFGGSSDAGIDVAARLIDKYLTWGEPPVQVAEKIATVKQAAAKHGRTLTYGIRLHVIVRETEEAAWKARTSSSASSTTAPLKRRRTSSRAWIPSVRAA